MSDLEIQFDLVAGKNELPLEIERITKSAKGATDAVEKTTDSFGKMGKAAKSAASGGQSAFSNFKSDISSIAFAGTAAISAIAGIAYSVKRFVDAAVESEENVSRLNVALQQTGIYSEQTSKDFQKLATEIQNTTRYSDDQAMALTATLQNLGQFTKEGLAKATKASIELASAFKLDLNTAAMLVGKAATGNIQAFQRMGIEIQKGKTDAETFANTLQALSRFEGASEKDAATLGGSFAMLGNQIGEAAETIGFAISDLLSLKENANRAAGGIKALNEEVKKTPLESGINALSIASRIAQRDITLLYDAYKIFADDVEKNPIKVRIDTENALKKQGPAAVSSFNALTSLNPNNLAPTQGGSLIGDIAKASAESTKLLLDTKARQEEINKKSEEERNKQRKAYDDLLKSVINAGKTQEQIIEDEATLRLKSANDLVKSRAISEKEFQELRLQIEKDYSDKIEKIDEHSRKEGLENYKKDLAEKEKLRKESEEKFAKIANQALGAATNVLQGAQGAKTLISGGIGAAANIFAPGTGEAAGALASQLMQGPEANREMIRQFAAAVPDLISAIVDSIPVIIEELSNQFPKVIDSMVNKFSDPKFIENISKAFIKAGIAMAKGYVESMINFIPDFFKDFGQNLASAIIDAVKQAVGSVGDIGGGFVDTVKEGWNSTVGEWTGLKFAHGGQVNSVPNGFPNDTFPAMLSSGELVVDRSTVNRLNEFIDNGQGQESGVTQAILVKILDRLSEPMNVSTTANVNGKAFADIMLQLSRNNARVTA